MSKANRSRSPSTHSSTTPKGTPKRSSHKPSQSVIHPLGQLFRNPSTNKNFDESDTQPEVAPGMFKSITAKARSLRYSLQEWILMKSIIFSLVIFLAFVMLTYFVLSLAGGYLPVIILSVLTSIALRPTKDALSSSIKDFLGITVSKGPNSSFFKRSMFLFIWKYIQDLVYYKQNTQLSRKRRQKIANFLKYFNLTGDVYAILMICITWILISKFGIEIVLYILGIILVADMFIRLFMDSLTFLTNQSTCLKRAKSRIQKNKEFSKAIDSTVATSVLFLFLIISIGLFIFMGFLLLMDIETIVINLKTSVSLLIQNINHSVSEYSGIQNAIDESFVVSFFKSYNESIYSYMENQNLKGVYTLFSGLINPVRNETSSIYRDFPALVDNPSEFHDCIKQNSLNSTMEFMKNIEAFYCNVLPYASRFSIDPLTTLKKIKDGVSFIFQILFGTILFEFYLFSKGALDYMFNFIVFCFCVYYLLHANTSVIYSATSLFPFDPKVRSELHDALVKSIKGSFLCSIKIFIYHFLLTWLAFDVLELDLGFTIAVAAAVFSTLPFIPSWVLCIPHSIYLFFGRNNLLAAILFPVCYLLISNKVYNDIYKKSIDIHPYITGLSIVMGIYAFDFQGIIYGPLLMCITVIVVELIKKYGISTDTMLKIQRKKIIIEELDSLERLTDHHQRRLDRKRSRSFEASTPF